MSPLLVGSDTVDKEPHQVFVGKGVALMQVWSIRSARYVAALMAAAIALTVACGPSAAPDEAAMEQERQNPAGVTASESAGGTGVDSTTVSAGATAAVATSSTTPESAGGNTPGPNPAEQDRPAQETQEPQPSQEGQQDTTGQGTGPTPSPAATGQGSEVAAATLPSAKAVPTAQPTPLMEDWEKELRTSAINRRGWQTDFSKRSVPYTEIFSGGVPRDGIPPIDHPRFTTVEEADGWLEEKEPVVALEIDGQAKAYPLQILTWHEIVNDELGGVPISATFCPLCNSAIVFDRRLEGAVYDFGVSGNLRNSDLIMWDRQTESWWQQLTGEAIVGELTGKQLDILPATIVSWRDFMTTYPEGQVLSRETGHSRNYGANPYVGYDEVGQSPFLFFGKDDERLQATERVAAVTVGGESVAYLFAYLEKEGVVHDTVGGREIAVFFLPGTRSALDGYSIADSREVGATGIFERKLDGQGLTFEATEAGFVDKETGTEWNIFGMGVSGPMAGQQLTPVVHANHFWFAWAAFKPDTRVVQ